MSGASQVDLRASSQDTQDLVFESYPGPAARSYQTLGAPHKNPSSAQINVFRRAKELY